MFKEQVGKNIALGLGEGFVSAMQDVQRQMQSSIPTEFETDVKTNINSLKLPLAGYRNETESSGFNIYIENFINNRSQDVQAFAQELEFYARRSNFAIG